MSVIEIINDSKDMQTRVNQLREQGKRIAFVPTMGFLHDGHLSLLKTGRKAADVLILSIFINPTQFGPNEDLDAYPQDFEKDVGLAEKEGVDFVFAPQKESLYGLNYQTYVMLEELPNHLCGLSRPVHFRGVTTIVTKLFNIVKPHIAVFGMKDFQQLAVIRQMTKDLDFDIEIIGAPTVRESDGLAMSSRNAYLKPEQRPAALTLYKALQVAKEAIQNGENDANRIIEQATAIITAFPENTIDYIALCDPDTLNDMPIIDRPVLMALAVKLDKTRLIDNIVIDLKS